MTILTACLAFLGAGAALGTLIGLAEQMCEWAMTRAVKRKTMSD